MSFLLGLILVLLSLYSLILSLLKKAGDRGTPKGGAESDKLWEDSTCIGCFGYVLFRFGEIGVCHYYMDIFIFVV